ncbi:MAG TPA: nitronate monooxygenase [Candidatus Cybelea sp.]|nr:nitronate monooxygenase [Candidatus Cybelea sp.]
MPYRTQFAERLGLDHPIIQAPMAGGGDSPDLVVAVCESGALGCFGAAYLAPAEIAATAEAERARTGRPFGINLFAPQPAPVPPNDIEPALRRIAPYFEELGLPPPALPADSRQPFEAQLAAALESGAAVFSFTMGLMPPAAAAAIKARGMLLVGTATNVHEARTLEDSGADALILQGSEAGGHRGTFAGEFESSAVGTMALVPQVADAVRIPVIASGGIMDGRGIAAALVLGAEAAQLGTAFLTCAESGIGEAYRSAILTAGDSETRFTCAFSGRPARGIVNRFMTEVEQGGKASILPFPYQNALTRPLRTAAAKQGRAEFLSLWAGQGLRMARRQSAADLIARLESETKAAVQRLR